MRSIAVLLAVSALGCSHAPLRTAGAPVTRDLTVAPVRRRQGPNAFTVNLVPTVLLQPAAALAGNAGGVEPDRTTGTLRVVLHRDDTIEYQLTIFNEDRRTFSSGHLYRGTADPDHLVATLFAGEVLSSRYIQLRGTGSIAKDVQPRALLDQFRETPGDFVVRIDGRAGSSAVLQGTLRQ